MSSVWTYEELRGYGDVVWSHDAWTLVTWNGGATFNVWTREQGGESYSNVDCFTVYGIEDDSAARMAARDWFADQLQLEDGPVPSDYSAAGMGE